MTLIFDLETTGLHPDNACVWDFACVAVNDGEIVSHFHSKVQPVLKHFTKTHRDLVQRISGLSESDLLELLDAPEIGEVRASFIQWMYEINASRMATSYNREFDFRFLEGPLWCLSLWEAPCVMNAVKERLGRRVNLTTACQHFGVLQVDVTETMLPEDCIPHRALPDALLAAHLAIKLGMG